MSELWSALRPRLEHLTNPLPLAELQLADTRRDEIAPLLIAELDALASDPAPAQADGYVLHLYAMLLLARWRDSRAYRPLAELGHLDESRVDTVFGQLVHDSYGRALASTCDGDLTPLTRLADDDAASTWARAAALEAMTLAALEGHCSRGPVIDFLADFGTREAQFLRDKPDAGADLELLDFLAAHALPLAVATSAGRATAERHLGRAGLLDRFQAVATRDDVVHAKPAPDIYLEAVRRLGIAPERCIAFEDSNVGLTAAHAAGTMAIMVPDILLPLPEVRDKCITVLGNLHEARRLMLVADHDAASAAHRVGYESPSQFSREYRRLFGAPPLQDILRLR